MRKNYIWWMLSLLSVLVIWELWRTDHSLAIKWSAYMGIVFLVLTLVPINALRWLPKKVQVVASFFVKHRRSLGITSGVLFYAHATLSIIEFEGWSWGFLLSQPIFLGVTALAVFGLLLLTSFGFTVQLLKQNWKKIQRLVWFALPLALLHSVLASSVYSGDISKVGVIGFGGLILFVLVEFWLNRNSPQKWKHLGLVIAGSIVAVVIFLVAPKHI